MYFASSAGVPAEEMGGRAPEDGVDSLLSFVVCPVLAEFCGDGRFFFLPSPTPVGLPSVLSPFTPESKNTAILKNANYIIMSCRTDKIFTLYHSNPSATAPLESMASHALTFR